MLKTTEQEREHVIGYMAARAPDEVVQLAQKVYSEQVNAALYDIWDVHTDCGRWWVITNPTHLYSQDQFPNMDLALTFHVGLSLRIPRSEERSITKFPIEPLASCWRTLEEASDALRHAEEVEDFQAVGMRCREALITLVHVAQELIQLPDGQARPKRSDFLAWSKIIAGVILSGSTHEERRGLLNSSVKNAWDFTRWLLHARTAHFHDAEAAIGVTELTLAVFTSALIRYIRGVPDRCLSCGSQRLFPERGVNSSNPNTIYERPVCGKCGWTGTPVIVVPSPATPGRPSPEGECIIMTAPLRNFPGRSSTGHNQT